MNSYYEKVGDAEAESLDQVTPFSIPDAWEWTRLKSVAQINPKNEAPDNVQASFVSMQAIESEFANIIYPEQKRWGSIKKGFTHFADGDIVFAKISPCFENGKYFIATNLRNGIGSGTTELFVLRPHSNGLVREYLLYYLECGYFVGGASKTFMGTVGQQRVKRDYVEEALVPIPPSSEQCRICDKLIDILGTLALQQR